MASSDFDSEAEAQLMGQPSQSRPWKKLIIGASASLALCGAIARLSYTRGLTAASDYESKFQIVTSPSRSVCSKTTDSCYDSGCCAVEGYTCFETQSGKAMCMKECDSKKFTCTQRTNSVLTEARVVPSQSLYCFAVVVVDNGCPIPSHELDLMNHQSENNLGIFQCEQNDLFSDKALSLSNGRAFTQVFEGDSDWKFAKRKSTGCWVNTGIFTDVWRVIAREGKWQQSDWLVKVDPDAVFVPARLRKSLENTYEAVSGSYYVNCPYVQYGFFGNLEVFSKIAFTTLLENIDDCKTDTETINWKVGINNGKYGPMGEDLFAQTCMDKHGVRRADAFGWTQDGACEAKRDSEKKKDKKFQPHCDWAYGASIHPFKKVDEWKECYRQTMASYPNPL
jgi:hypothetical protein